jgi:hypothetical protein
MQGQHRKALPGGTRTLAFRSLSPPIRGKSGIKDMAAIANRNRDYVFP